MFLLALFPSNSKYIKKKGGHAPKPAVEEHKPSSILPLCGPGDGKVTVPQLGAGRTPALS